MYFIYINNLMRTRHQAILINETTKKNLNKELSLDICTEIEIKEELKNFYEENITTNDIEISTSDKEEDKDEDQIIMDIHLPYEEESNLKNLPNSKFYINDKAIISDIDYDAYDYIPNNEINIKTTRTHLNFINNSNEKENFDTSVEKLDIFKKLNEKINGKMQAKADLEEKLKKIERSEKGKLKNKIISSKNTKYLNSETDNKINKASTIKITNNDNDNLKNTYTTNVNSNKIQKLLNIFDKNNKKEKIEKNEKNEKNEKPEKKNKKSEKKSSEKYEIESNNTLKFGTKIKFNDIIKQITFWNEEMKNGKIKQNNDFIKNPKKRGIIKIDCFKLFNINTQTIKNVKELINNLDNDVKSKKNLSEENKQKVHII